MNDTPYRATVSPARHLGNQIARKNDVKSNVKSDDIAR